MIQEGIFNMMVMYAPLQAFVSGRITPVILPKNPTFPAITFFDVTETTTVNLDKTAVATTSIEIDVWAKSYLEVKNIQMVLHNLFDGFTGTLSDDTQIKQTTSSNNPDFFEKEASLFRASTTFVFTT